MGCCGSTSVSREEKTANVYIQPTWTGLLSTTFDNSTMYISNEQIGTASTTVHGSTIEDYLSQHVSFIPIDESSPTQYAIQATGTDYYFTVKTATHKIECNSTTFPSANGNGAFNIMLHSIGLI